MLSINLHVKLINPLKIPLSDFPAFSVLPGDSDEEHLGPCPLHAPRLVRQCPHIQSPQWILHIFPIQSCKSYTHMGLFLWHVLLFYSTCICNTTKFFIISIKFIMNFFHLCSLICYCNSEWIHLYVDLLLLLQFIYF